MFLRSLRTLVIQLQMSSGIKLNRVVPCRFSRGTRDERHDDWSWLSYQRGCLKKTEIRTQNDTSEIGTKPGKICKYTAIVKCPQFQQNVFFVLALVDEKQGGSQIGEEGLEVGVDLCFYNDFTKQLTKLQKCVQCRIIPVRYQQQTLAMSPGVPSLGLKTFKESLFIGEALSFW